MARALLQIRYNDKDNPDAYRILTRWREAGYSDRDIVEIALKALEGWKPEDFAELTLQGGTLKFMVQQALRKAGLPTLEEIDEVLRAALEDYAIDTSKKGKERETSGVSKELREAFRSRTTRRDDGEDWD